MFFAKNFELGNKDDPPYEDTKYILNEESIHYLSRATESVTIAQWISNKLQEEDIDPQTNIIIDATANVGGDTL